MKSQNEMLLAELKRGPVTPLAALRTMGIYRLAARISNLRARGYKITTVRKRVRTRNGKANVAEYILED